MILQAVFSRKLGGPIRRPAVWMQGIQRGLIRRPRLLLSLAIVCVLYEGSAIVAIAYENVAEVDVYANGIAGSMFLFFYAYLILPMILLGSPYLLLLWILGTVARHSRFSGRLASLSMLGLGAAVLAITVIQWQSWAPALNHHSYTNECTAEDICPRWIGHYWGNIIAGATFALAGMVTGVISRRWGFGAQRGHLLLRIALGILVLPFIATIAVGAYEATTIKVETQYGSWVSPLDRAGWAPDDVCPICEDMMLWTAAIVLIQLAVLALVRRRTIGFATLACLATAVALAYWLPMALTAFLNPPWPGLEHSLLPPDDLAVAASRREGLYWGVAALLLAALAFRRHLAFRRLRVHPPR
jgi:hypothetical protein